jgi:hypothetical protein
LGYREARAQLLQLQGQSRQLRASYTVLKDDMLAQKADQVDAELAALTDLLGAFNAAVGRAYERLGTSRETEKKAEPKGAPRLSSPTGPDPAASR